MPSTLRTAILVKVEWRFARFSACTTWFNAPCPCADQLEMSPPLSTAGFPLDIQKNKFSLGSISSQNQSCVDKGLRCDKVVHTDLNPAPPHYTYCLNGLAPC